MRVEKLKNRQQFLSLGKRASRSVLPSMIVLHAPCEDGTVQVGFTASKKVGNAVARNLAKRRMRAIFDEVIRLNPQFLAPSGIAFNFIARAYVLNRDYTKMVNELKAMLEKELNCQC